MGWTTFLLTYLLGGLTFLPAVAIVVLLHAYFTFPRREDAASLQANPADDLVQPGDDLAALKAAQKPRTSHREHDVAAGYFAVCREYTPMGINAKPIERATPVGSATIAVPSQSVYQSMYRSIFDRKQPTGLLDNHKNASQRPRKAGNVFYVTLRHGHMMLFDDEEQLEVRHVISLAHHEVSIYSGGDRTPEGELFIKRNAICLARKADASDVAPDSKLSKPFFLFSENCSAKEDFYFALLRNQEENFSAENLAPSPLNFDVRNIISLVQKLHSSEDHLQTRWLNALTGRIFLGIYKTKDIEHFIREKITKKIARVKRPSFLSNIAIKGIDTGDAAPYFTNPRLKDLTVEGECGVEADLKYTGSFRIEVAATARIDLGSRFKVREVSLLLAVVVRKIDGRANFKIKPPPSNRIWFSFQQMPKIEMTIEPIVSSRQITYTVILRQIENRIKEVIAETLVMPFWDDVPFFNTEHKKWRGGIFAGDDEIVPSRNLETGLAQIGDVDDVDRLEEHSVPGYEIPAIEKSNTTSVETSPTTGLFGRKMTHKGLASPMKSAFGLPAASASTSHVEIKSDASSVPRLARSSSFANTQAPVVGTDATNADIFKPSTSPPNESPAAAAMATISKSHASSADTPPLAPFKPYITSKSSGNSSESSREGTDTEKTQEKGNDAETSSQLRRNTASSAGSLDDGGNKASSHSKKASTISQTGSVRSQTGSLSRGLFGRRENNSSPSAPSSPASGVDQQKRTALATVANAAASAKRWSLTALQRHNEGGAAGATAKNGTASGDGESQPSLNEPMGRGRPLPPPGVPLPMPDKRAKTNSISMLKRRAAPPPLPPALPERPAAELVTEPRAVSPPPLPKRRQSLAADDHGDGDSMLVVAAPDDSEPTTPSDTGKPSFDHPFLDDAEAGGKQVEVPSHEEETMPGAHAGPEDEVSHHLPLVEGRDPHTLEGDEEDFSAWMDSQDAADDPSGGIISSEGMTQ